MDTSRPSSEKKFRSNSVLTQECIDSILDAIKKGGTKKHAAEAFGVWEGHFYQALQQGITDLKYNETDTIWARMVKSLRAIELEEISKCRCEIRESDKGHKGAEWTLEHAYWREFCGDAKIIQLAEEVDELKVEKANHEKQAEKS